MDEEVRLLVWLIARYDHSTARAANRSCVSLQCYLLRCDFFMALLSLLSIFLSFSLEPLYPGLAGFNGLHRAYFPLYPGALDSPDFVPRSCRAVPGRVLPPSMPTYGYLGGRPCATTSAIPATKAPRTSPTGSSRATLGPSAISARRAARLFAHDGSALRPRVRRDRSGSRSTMQDAGED